MSEQTHEQAAVHQDKYDQMMRLADLFDSSGDEMRERAKLGAEVLADEAVSDSADLSRATYTRAEDEILAATTGKNGLMVRSVELDADALIIRATVLTYRWIDDLQVAAYRTLGSIAARAVGYLAPEVALGGAILSAGLIETDALDRDGLASYLNELADANPAADGPLRQRGRRPARRPPDARPAHGLRPRRLRRCGRDPWRAAGRRRSGVPGGLLRRAARRRGRLRGLPSRTRPGPPAPTSAPRARSRS